MIGQPAGGPPPLSLFPSRPPLWAAIALITLFGLWLRVHDLGRLSLWLDESYSVWFSSQGWSYLWNEVPKFDTHPTFYYSLLKLWRAAFGEDEFTLRLLSALVNTATIPAVAAIAWLCGSRETRATAAALAALLFACSSTQLSASQDARPYVFMTLGLAIALLGAARVMTGGERAARPVWRMAGQDPAMALALAAIGIGIALMGWSHNLGPLFGLCLGLCLVVWWGTSGGRSGGGLVNLLLSAALALLLYAPHFPTLHMQMDTLGAGGFWVRPPSVFGIFYTMLQMPLGNGGAAPLPLLLGGLSLLAGLAGLWVLLRNAWRQGRSPALAWTLLVMGLLPAAVSFVLSHILQPIFLFRTLQPSQVPVIVAMSFAPFLRPAARRAVSAGLVAVAGMTVWFVDSTRNRPIEQWREAVSAIRDTATGGVPRVVVMPAEAELPLRYYLDRLAIPVDLLTVPGSYPVLSSEHSYPAGGGGSPAITPAMAAELPRRWETAERIWFLSRAGHVFDPDLLVETTVRATFPCVISDRGIRPRYVLLSRRMADGTCPAG